VYAPNSCVMSTVIFACKSNSCRSQMAEGWAKEWIRDKKDTFNKKLKGLKEENETGICPVTERSISVIDNFMVASVALDSSAVFTTEPSQSSLEIMTHQQRKSVKSKAVAAMAEDGVDISCYIPKTADEILLILDGKDIFEGDKQDSNYHSTSSVEQDDAQIDISAQEEKSSLDGPIIDSEITGVNNASIDRLIVLCSCGDNMKKNLMQCSKYVEEWDIEPPTAAAKSGEGDGAYRRVSLEIRDEVNSMMESLLGTVLEQ